MRLPSPANCFQVSEQHEWVEGYRPILMDDTWTRPVVVFAPHRGEIWMMTNTQRDYVNMFSSNPAVLQVPSRVLLKTEEELNRQTNSSFTLSNVVAWPTPVKITAASTHNPGRRLSEDVVVYPRFHIDSVYVAQAQASYADRQRVTVVVRLPWGLPPYLDAFQAVLHKPTFTWRGQKHTMESPSWGDEETLTVLQADGQRELRQSIQLVIEPPEFDDPIDRVRWRRARNIDFTMKVELEDRSASCELVEDGTATLRFSVRNPAYGRRR